MNFDIVVGFDLQGRQSEYLLFFCTLIIIDVYIPSPPSVYKTKRFQRTQCDYTCGDVSSQSKEVHAHREDCWESGHWTVDSRQALAFGTTQRFRPLSVARVARAQPDLALDQYLHVSSWPGWSSHGIAHAKGSRNLG